MRDSDADVLLTISLYLYLYRYRHSMCKAKSQIWRSTDDVAIHEAALERVVRRYLGLPSPVSGRLNIDSTQDAARVKTNVPEVRS